MAAAQAGPAAGTRGGDPPLVAERTLARGEGLPRQEEEGQSASNIFLFGGLLSGLFHFCVYGTGTVFHWGYPAH